MEEEIIAVELRDGWSELISEKSAKPMDGGWKRLPPDRPGTIEIVRSADEVKEEEKR